VEDRGVGDTGVDDCGVGYAGMEDHGVGDARAEDDIMGLPRWRGPHEDARMSALKKERAFRLRTVACGGGGAPSAWRKWMVQTSNDLENFHPAPSGYILVAHHCRCQRQTDSDDVASLPMPKANRQWCATPLSVCLKG